MRNIIDTCNTVARELDEYAAFMEAYTAKAGGEGRNGFSRHMRVRAVELRSVAESTAATRDRLVRAIRRFTVDVAGGDTPNGEEERCLDRLGDALERRDMSAAGDAFCAYAIARAEDTAALRAAAEDHFGGDFLSPEQVA